MYTRGGRDHDDHDNKMIIIITSHDDYHIHNDDHHIQNDDRHMCTSGGREEGNSRESISSALSCYSWTHFQNDPHPTQPHKMFLKKNTFAFYP